MLFKNYIVYRGQDEKYNDLPNSVWVTEDYDTAKQYGKVIKYELNGNLNLLDADVTEGEELAEEFDADPLDIYYEPTEEFIYFLKEKGYDGYILNFNDIFIFDNSKLNLIK